MKRVRSATGLVLLALAACASGEAAGERRGTTPGEAVAPEAQRQAALADAAASERVERVPTPAVIRGLYVNRWAMLGRRGHALMELAKTTEVNALVIDVKDDRGLMLYRSRVPLAREIGADTVMPLPLDRLRAVLDTMRAYGIYPIARIVVVKDPILANARPQWAIRRNSDMQPWLDKNGNPWLDPHHGEVWKYAADIAEEAFDLGFSEIQLDYVRFPDERRLVHEAIFPLSQGRHRAQVIRDQLAYTRGLLRAREIRMTIDVFGLTATDTTDMGIGQRWEMFADQADAILPMTYPSHFAPGTYGLASPNARPYATIDRAMKDVTRRTARLRNAGRIIPWYQDFTLGPPRYGAEEVRAQMQAGYDNGYHDWILWNPGSRYNVAALRPKTALEEAIRLVMEGAATRARSDSALTDSVRARAAGVTASAVEQPRE